MSEQHLHNKLGNAIGECKKRLYERLKSGVSLDDASASFVGEIRIGLETISRAESENVKAETVPSSS